MKVTQEIIEYCGLKPSNVEYVDVGNNPNPVALYLHLNYDEVLSLSIKLINNLHILWTHGNWSPINILENPYQCKQSPHSPADYFQENISILFSMPLRKEGCIV